ncbi:MAG: GTP cyclohydrolase II [Alphaproteobacteria bacterium]|jgi:GTP cyclohydrolase II
MKQQEQTTARAPIGHDRSVSAVARALSDLRRGVPVVLRPAPSHGDQAALIVGAAENGFRVMHDLHERRLDSNADNGGIICAVTATRAQVLGLDQDGVTPVVLRASTVFTAADIESVVDDTAESTISPALSSTKANALETLAVALVRLSRLLPAALLAPCDGEPEVVAKRDNLLIVDADDIGQFQDASENLLDALIEVDIPLAGAEVASVTAFRPADGGKPHIAIVVGNPDPTRPVLARLHSECFTGDLLGSLRCDCGDQLRGAIAAIGDAGGGVLLYLAQEGRGIGLVNKLRAYKLQDSGFDTIDANERLGFDADERVYTPAAAMLKKLGFNSVRLMTNNPIKVAALSAHGVIISDRVPHAFPANGHNEHYLQTKANRGGHIL